jgi:very-short-patch-repair endonuclease
MTSTLETTLANQIRAAGLPAPVTEFLFHPDRQWRADFAWPEAMVILEVEGGTWTRGRHVRPKGFAEDICKANAAQLMGYTVLRATGEQIRQGLAIQWLSEALERFYGPSEQAEQEEAA